MIKSESISKDDLQYDSLQFETLMRLGIQYAEQLSGEIWTDFNEHDPGVTILEYLCFGITDIAYRTDFSITDILFSNTGENQAVNNAFFPLQEILPTGAISIKDYRKLIIDSIQGVQNVWLEPIENHLQKYKGLYHVHLQIQEEEDYLAEDLIKKTRELLHANRNLCEDFEGISVLQATYITLEADIDLATSVIPESVLAHIILEVEHFLNPAVNLHNPDDLQKEGMRYDDIYDGPPMKNGIIINSELKNLYTEIHLAEIKAAIANVKGVQHINNLRVRIKGIPVKTDVIQLEKYTYCRLDMRTMGSKGDPPMLNFYNSGLPLTINVFQTQQIFQSLISKIKKGYRIRYTQSIKSTKLKQKHNQAIFDYISIQNFFPHIYGIGPYGLPIGANKLQRDQAKQLKAYLLFFELLLASYLKQLANVRNLFDIDKTCPQSYFLQFPKEIPDIDALIKTSADNPQKKAYAQWVLEEIAKEINPSSDRLHIFMDHLLARFGVQFASGQLAKKLALNEANEKAINEKVLTAKRSLLQAYVPLSRQRATAFNYTKKAWETDNISTLKKRICIELQLPNSQNTHWAASPVMSKLKLSAHKKNSAPPKHFNLKKMLFTGTKRYRYTIEDTGELFQVIFKASKNDPPYIIFECETYEDAESKIKDFIQLLQDMNEQSKGFYLIEHLLLRPSHLPLWNLKIGPKSDEPLLQTWKKDKLKAQSYIADDLLIIASQRRNFSVLKGKTQYFILLKNDSHPILISEEKYQNEALAEQAISHIIHELDHIKKKHPAQINQWIHLERELLKGLFIDADFYSARISIVLPNWNALFQNEDFKNFFKHAVSQHVPTHLAVDFHWMNFAQMQQFESLFKQWLSFKQNGNSNAALDELSLKLIQLLDKNQFEKTEIPNGKNEILLSEEAIQSIAQDISISEIHDPKNLCLIVGIDTRIEAALNTEGICNWRDIAYSSKQRLLRIIEKADISTNNLPIASWYKQALLGIQFKWQELYHLQEQIRVEMAITMAASEEE